MNKKVLEMFKWESNPFAFKILPNLFVGYEKESEQLINGLSNGDKFSLLLGPTGSGKTTFVKSLLKKFNQHKHVLYLPKPPKDSRDWIQVFNKIIKPRFSFFRRNKNIDLYNLSDELNKKLKREKCLVFVDEAHEASLNSLEWLRTITDQTDNLSIVLAGLPVFETILKNNLESFKKRFSIEIKLSNLTKSETRELIKRRVENIGGDDIKPFTSDVIEIIYDKTGGFPREVLRMCNELVQLAIEKGISTVDSEFLKEEIESEPRISLETVNTLPERQKLILQTLADKGQLTPSEIAKNMKLEEYKNKDNAIRSINNLLRRLMQIKLVERGRVGKTYKYQVSSRFQPVMVKS